ncbi:hypothetical protein [Hymenobacter jeollabukensis]|uniref:Uncharacterized protein n=1 Tax=Hymenobacter jeollabukensis TaxID=2025313 RepID=A0A5R8WKU3_9BACT|nr:hypothetical protein [Hymenobacter jeollabukensis]TLM89366.1 hypothetical protein FDY95_20040 [Hymenobacter jeollabukensis]
MSQPPRTYAAWAELLERCGQGDDATLELLGQGTWQPDAGTAIRFANLVNAAYTARKQRWLDGFSRSQCVGPAIRSPQDFAQLLRQATANLAPLYRLTSLPALPADMRQTLQTDLTKFVQDVAATLRDNVQREGGNRREELLLALRGFGIPPTTPVTPAPPSTAPTGVGRRIVF